MRHQISHPTRTLVTFYSDGLCRLHIQSHNYLRLFVNIKLRMKHCNGHVNDVYICFVVLVCIFEVQVSNSQLSHRKHYHTSKIHPTVDNSSFQLISFQIFLDSTRCKRYMYKLQILIELSISEKGFFTAVCISHPCFIALPYFTYRLICTSN